MVTAIPYKLRLARVLEEHRERLGGYSQLARAITQVYPGPPPLMRKGKDKGRPREVVDRRKLQGIVENKPRLNLSLDDLAALDVYLQAYGEGLSYRPLFDNPNLVHAFSDSGRVTILLGTKQDEEGAHFPFWDVLATAEWLRCLTTSEVSLQLDIQEVPMRPMFKPAEWRPDEGWGTLFADRGPSLIVLGSNRMMPAADVMLCMMCGGDPFTNQKFAEKRDLPFHFCWNPGLTNVLPSRFQVDPDDIAEHDEAAAEKIRSGEGSALAVGKQVFFDPIAKRGWGDGYGVCVVQRRASGAVWMLCGGVSGPMTLAVAKAAQRLPIRFSDTPASDHSPAYCTIVDGQVPESMKDDNKSQQDFGEKIVTGPTPWLPAVPEVAKID